MVSYEDRVKNPGLYSSNNSYEERVKNPGVNNVGTTSNEISNIINTTDKDELWLRYNNDSTFRYLINSNLELRNKFNRIFKSYLDTQTTRLR